MILSTYRNYFFKTLVDSFNQSKMLKNQLNIFDANINCFIVNAFAK